MLWGYINKYSRLSRRGVAKTSLSTLLVSLLSCNFVERLEATKERETSFLWRKEEKSGKKVAAASLGHRGCFLRFPRSAISLRSKGFSQ